MDGLEGFEVVLAEIGDGFVVGDLFAGQPDDLDVALAFDFEQAGGTEAMEVAVEIEFEQHGRIVRRGAGGGAAGFGELQLGQIERGDEGVEKADGIFGGDVVFQPFGEEQGLGRPARCDDSYLSETTPERKGFKQ